MCKFKSFGVCMWLCLAMAPHAWAQRLRIEVGSANFKPYPVAVPDLVIAPGDQITSSQALDLSRLLQNDVNMARSLELVPPKTYLAAANEPAESPKYADWSSIGASGLIRGVLSSDGKSVLVNWYFYDVIGQRQALKQVCHQPIETASRCVHTFLDDVIELLTGERGVFSTRVAFVKKVGKTKNIFTCDIDGGHMQRVTHNDSLNLLPAWDPTGQYLLFTSYLHGNSDLYRIRLGTETQNPDLLDSVSKQRGLNIGAAVSHDGKKIALTLSKDGNTEIYVMDWDGKNLKRLTDSWGQDVSPTWSSDGTRLAFVSSRSGSPHIYVMNADGSKQRRLTFQGTYNQEPDWSPRPDGQIAFTARDEKLVYDIFLVHPDTGEITRLTQDEGHNDSPSFSPDGYHLAFTSTRNKDMGKMLWIMNADGKQQHALNVPVDFYETPSWGPRM